MYYQTNPFMIHRNEGKMMTITEKAASQMAQGQELLVTRRVYFGQFFVVENGNEIARLTLKHWDGDHDRDDWDCIIAGDRDAIAPVLEQVRKYFPMAKGNF